MWIDVDRKQQLKEVVDQEEEAVQNRTETQNKKSRWTPSTPNETVKEEAKEPFKEKVREGTQVPFNETTKDGTQEPWQHDELGGVEEKEGSKV